MSLRTLEEFFIFIPEYRYHFHEKYNGFYVGAHMGFTLFNMQKWNKPLNSYQEGLGYLIGATIGYLFNIRVIYRGIL